MSANFFDGYPRFYESSVVGASANRLNSRYRAMIEPNLDCIREHSILDIASHDGRWSFAALKAGASHVVGIEARPHLVERANETCRLYDIVPGAFSFVGADVFNVLPSVSPGSVDTVFCFGFFYHMMHHQLLLSMIVALKAKHLILDTRICPSEEPVIEVRVESTKEDANAAPAPSDVMETTVVGYPSRAAIELMLGSYGFHYHYFDWAGAPITDWSNIEDYRDGLRVTLRADLQPAEAACCSAVE
jgi:hypothetical protein